MERWPSLGLSTGLERSYRLEETVGAGTYGVVRRALERTRGETYAVKSIAKRPKGLAMLKVPRYLEKVQREIDVMNHLGKSLACVYLHETYEDQKNVHLVMELCTGGSLWDSASRRMREGSFNEQRVATIARAALRTVAQCHAKGIMYRDVKPENFLYYDDSPEAPLKATDFGLATYFQPGQLFSERCGTVHYVSPEMVKQAYGAETDLWSTGVMIYQLLSGRMPFEDEYNETPTRKEVFSSILYGTLDLTHEPWPRISAGAKDLLALLLNRDPLRRPSAIECLQHPWVKEGGVAEDKPLGGDIVQRLQRFGTYGAFRQVAFRQVLERVDAPLLDLDRIRQLFQQLDPDKTGMVQFSALSQSLESAGYRLDPRERDQLLQNLESVCTPAHPEACGHDVVYWEDFAAALMDWRTLETSSDWEELVSDVFVSLDTNGSGFIEEEDIANWLCELGTVNSQRCVSDVSAAIRESDFDKDGRISLQDLFRLLEVNPVEGLDLYESRI